jgi:hypothetical protein
LLTKRRGNVKLSKAYVCFSCEEVSDGAPYGRCPACDSDDVYPLGWLGCSEEERNRWFTLIRPKQPVPRNGVVEHHLLKPSS